MIGFVPFGSYVEINSLQLAVCVGVLGHGKEILRIKNKLLRMCMAYRRTFKQLSLGTPGAPGRYLQVCLLFILFFHAGTTRRLLASYRCRTPPFTTRTNRIGVEYM